MKDRCKFKTCWSVNIFKVTYTNLTKQCSWQLKFRLDDVSLSIGDFLNETTSEITLSKTEMFELCGPNYIQTIYKNWFSSSLLFIRLASQKNSYTKLKLPSTLEISETPSFLWIFYAWHKHRTYDEHPSFKRNRWTKKPASINRNKKWFKKRIINLMLSITCP